VLSVFVLEYEPVAVGWEHDHNLWCRLDERLVWIAALFVVIMACAHPLSRM
jgi:hypothetical protein